MTDHLGPDSAFSNRQLGPLEELFWHYGRATPFHFSLAAEIRGEADFEAWRRGLNVLQSSREMLRVGVRRRSDGVLAFEAGTGEIPLRVVEGKNPTLQSEIAREMASPFEASDLPLIRGVLLTEPQRSTLILTADHAIMDGIGLAQVVRDLLRVMAGEFLDAEELSGPFEQLAGVPAAFWRKRGTGRDTEALAPLQQLRGAGTVPQISILKLPAEQTIALIGAARSNGTTVQGALCAALVIVGRGCAQGWKDGDVRLLSPMDLRPVVGLGNAPVLAIAVPVLHAFPKDSDDFWKTARNLKAELQRYESPEVLAMLGNAVVDEAHRGLSSVSAAEFMIEHFTSEGMVSNLGVQHFEANGSALALENLWGPTLLTGVEGEQVIGAVTVAGALHLTHTSMSPFPRLLQTIASLIEQHLGVPPEHNVS